ncbi:MAG: DinB family protein [Chloroflexi bacterium]|nr:DinB family protein [Chloroflexota bacterium]MBK6712174.1 DinB family protein [Chloroflexota bacterium]MBK7179130.1 DinB family protein [Chloroflexota bacterium]MBK7920118.1 DinB family protein [Chloroflexota bacterium]MBK8932147.1 DinB family protein [Chloroflexota bacterium]
MLQEPPPVAELLAELERFATAVSQILATDSIDWQWRPSPGEWSLTELCCHLRDVEQEVHQPRFLSMMSTANAFISGATSDDWVAERQYARQNGRVALHEFLAARDRTIAMLPQPGDPIWARQGRHSFFGPTSTHELLNLAVKHDLAHWEQLRTLLRH